MKTLFAIAATVAVASDLSKPVSKADYEKAKADEAKAAKAKAAREKKMAAVNKVVQMLEDLQTQVLAEGEKEAASYNKFACFCKDTTAERSDAITKGKDEQNALTAQINQLNSRRDQRDTDIKTQQKLIKKLAKEMKDAKRERKETFTIYETNEADLSGALTGIAGAIEVLKSSKNPSLLQIQSTMETVKTAQALADALGYSSAASKREFTAFLQADPGVPMENYKFHSEGVIATLEKLQRDFRKTKQEIDAEEVKSVAEHDALMQEKTDQTRAAKKKLDKARKDKEDTIKNIASASDQLTTVSSDLLDDKQYLMKTAEMCQNTAKTYDVRSKVRADEISALTSATEIVKSTVVAKTSAATVRFIQQGFGTAMITAMLQDDDAMEAVEAEAEAVEKPVNFLQKAIQRHAAQDSPDGARELVINLLRTQGSKLKSTLLASLATQITADPFAKIKKLIQELIERLLTEAANEANQKGWCDKAQADAKQKRDYSSQEIERLNGEMAELEATRDTLMEEINTLGKEIKDLDERRDKATAMRKAEKAENKATVEEAEIGLGAIKMAIDILDKFYKTAAKSKVDLSLAQGPEDDAPDAGFDIGEAYTGAGGESGGIIGMMDVIKSDFERTIKVTTEAEAKAEADYNDFMTESGMSHAEKTMARDQKKKQHRNTVEDLSEADSDMAAETKILLTSISELLDLKPTCIDTGMSYEERVARREDEIESLKKALCILNAYAEYGPEGLADAC